MYMADYDDRFPLSAYRATAGSHVEPAANQPIWPAYVADYVQNHEVFICPDGGPETCYAETWADRGRCSLGINRDLEDTTKNLPLSTVLIDNASRTILVADSTPGPSDLPDNMRGFQIQCDRQPNTQAAIGSRHFDGTNIGFVDGHAAWYRSERVWQMTNPADLLWKPGQVETY